MEIAVGEDTGCRRGAIGNWGSAPGLQTCWNVSSPPKMSNNGNYTDTYYFQDFPAALSLCSATCCLQTRKQRHMMSLSQRWSAHSVSFLPASKDQAQSLAPESPFRLPFSAAYLNHIWKSKCVPNLASSSLPGLLLLCQTLASAWDQLDIQTRSVSSSSLPHLHIPAANARVCPFS